MDIRQHSPTWPDLASTQANTGLPDLESSFAAIVPMECKSLDRGQPTAITVTPLK